MNFKKSVDFSLSWYERYVNLESYLISDISKNFLQEQLNIFNRYKHMPVSEIPIGTVLLWIVFNSASMVNYMDEKYQLIDPKDLVSFIIFNTALAEWKPSHSLNWVRYFYLFEIYQGMLLIKVKDEISGTTSFNGSTGLFDFESYDHLHESVISKS